MQKGITWLPAIFIVAAVILGGVIGYAIWSIPELVNTQEEPAVVVTNGNGNTNTTANTNSAGNTNAEPAEPTALYGAPQEPFTTAGSNVLVFAYQKTTDRLMSRIAKVNAATGEIIATAQLSTLDLQTTLQLPEVPSRPSLFRFGADGDSALFLLSASTPSPFTGIFRTSITEPTKIETIVLYDKDNLFNGDIPTISEMALNAATNQAVFIIAGDGSGAKNHYVKSVDLATKTVNDMGAYATQPQIVGFPENGTLLEILYSNSPQRKDGKEIDVKWYYDKIGLADGKVTSTKLLVDEAAITDSANENIYTSLQPDSIAPNNNVVSYGYYRKTDEESTNVVAFRNITSGEIGYQTFSGYGGTYNFPWSPDSGKIVLSKYSSDGTTGVIFDLAKGDVGTISDFGTARLWYPSDLIVFLTGSNTLASYNLGTKKRLSIFSETINDYSEYGGGNQSLSGMRWVNR